MPFEQVFRNFVSWELWLALQPSQESSDVRWRGARRRLAGAAGVHDTTDNVKPDPEFAFQLRPVVGTMLSPVLNPDGASV